MSIWVLKIPMTSRLKIEVASSRSQVSLGALRRVRELGRGGFGRVIEAVVFSFFCGAKKAKLGHTRWCPPVISWFINPMNTIDISTINHSYWSYKPT